MSVKRALVTGAARRLGREMALCLAADGFDVAVHFATSQADADATAQDILDLGQNAITLKADLLEKSQCAGLLNRAATELGGPIEVLINNASIFEYDNLDSATRESWDRHVGSNLRAPFILTQEFARQVPPPDRDENNELMARGLIVNMVDQRVKKLTPEFMTYSIAKAALWSFTQTAAQALAPAVRVNAIAPGPTMIGSRQSDQHFSSQRANTILKRGANPSDISHALKYLLHAPSVTGQLMMVDGGQHMAWKTPDIINTD